MFLKLSKLPPWVCWRGGEGGGGQQACFNRGGGQQACFNRGGGQQACQIDEGGNRLAK